MTDNANKLFAEFPEVTTQLWEERIIADLKGKDYEKSLVWRSGEGISIKPYYRAENISELSYLDIAPGVFPFVRGNYPENNWLIRQDIIVDDFEAANKKALEVLGKGANSIGFVFCCPKPVTTDGLKLLLKDICLEAAEINFVCKCKNCCLTKVFADLVNEGKWDNNKVTASVDNDPLGEFLLTGKLDENPGVAVFESLKEKIEAGALLPNFRTLTVNGKYFGNSGASIIQELAFSLAQGVEYLNQLSELGLPVDEIATRIKFNLSVGGNYFFEIARLRAGRLLWAQILKAFGLKNPENARMIVHSETVAYNKTVYDPYVNLLRTQTEAMSAALGGAHSVTLLPFDAIYQAPTAFSERLARNQQILLKEESYFDKVADPAGGAYYIEGLTDAIAGQAWGLFIQVEEQGGFLNAIRKGFVQQQVKQMAEKRGQNLAMRRENLLGVNQFPNFSEVISTSLPDTVFQPSGQPGDAAIETLQAQRGAATIEELRYKTDRYALQNGRPLVFMLTIGNLAMRKARAQFACNFFAVAGFNVMDNNGFDTVDQGLEAARSANAAIIVVCSSDEEYATIVPEVIQKAADTVVVVAGNPACRPELETAGMKNFIHVRSNLLNELQLYQSILKI